MFGFAKFIVFGWLMDARSGQPTLHIGFALSFECTVSIGLVYLVKFTEV